MGLVTSGHRKDYGSYRDSFDDKLMHSFVGFKRTGLTYDADRGRQIAPAPE